MISIAIPASTAMACNLEHALQTKITSGSYKVFVNDVYLDKYLANNVYVNAGSDPSIGGGTFSEWLVEGKNTVRIEFDGDGGEFLITEKCHGVRTDGKLVDQVAFDSPSSKTMSFVHNIPVAAEYLMAEIADDAGLMDAVKRFQNAVRARDADTVFAMQAPFFRDAKRQGIPIDSVKLFTRAVLKTGAITAPESLVATPVMGGRVYQILDAGFRSPVSVTMTLEDGTNTWKSGTFWARFDGKWGVIGL